MYNTIPAIVVAKTAIIHETPCDLGILVSSGKPTRTTINSSKAPREDEVRIRSYAVQCRVPIMTTLTGATAAAKGIAALKKHGVTVCGLQE